MARVKKEYFYSCKNGSIYLSMTSPSGSLAARGEGGDYFKA
jgi:hypothetical protein